MKVIIKRLELICVMIANFSGWLSFVKPEIIDKYIKENKR